MSLSIRVRADNGALVVRLAGAADAAMLAPLREAVVAALDDSDVVVLDLDELTTVDPAGLRDLLCHALGANSRGRLRIVASRCSTRSLLEQSGIHRLVEVRGSLPDGLAGQATSPGTPDQNGVGAQWARRA